MCFFLRVLGSGEVALWATSLGPKPSLFIVLLFFCLAFSFLCFLIQKTLFPLEKVIFCLFLSVSLSFSLAFFGLPLFQFLFFFFSLSLSLSLSRSCPFFFLLVFFIAFFWFLVFVSFFPFLSSLLLFHERNNIKILNCKVFLHQYFLFLVSCLVFLSNPFFLSLLFPDFNLCFLFNINVFSV